MPHLVQRGQNRTCEIPLEVPCGDSYIPPAARAVVGMRALIQTSGLKVIADRLYHPEVPLPLCLFGVKTLDPPAVRTFSPSCLTRKGNGKRLNFFKDGIDRINGQSLFIFPHQPGHYIAVTQQSAHHFLIGKLALQVRHQHPVIVVFSRFLPDNFRREIQRRIILVFPSGNPHQRRTFLCRHLRHSSLQRGKLGFSRRLKRLFHLISRQDAVPQPRKIFQLLRAPCRTLSRHNNPHIPRQRLIKVVQQLQLPHQTPERLQFSYLFHYSHLSCA